MNEKQKQNQKEIKEAINNILLGRNQLFTHCDIDVTGLDEYLEPIIKECRRKIK